MESGASFQLSFSDELLRVTAKLQSTPAQVQKASGRAARKTMRWLTTAMARDIGQALKVPQRSLKSRLTTSTAGQGDDQVHILWFGTQPLAAEQVGRPRQGQRGTSVAGRRFDGAFYRGVYDGTKRVWIRKSQGRFPLLRVTIELQNIAAEVFRRYERRALARYAELIEQELNYAVNHER